MANFLSIRLIPADPAAGHEEEFRSPNWDWALAQTSEEEVGCRKAEGQVHAVVMGPESNGEYSLFIDVDSLVDSHLITPKDSHPVM